MTSIKSQIIEILSQTKVRHYMSDYPHSYPNKIWIPQRLAWKFKIAHVCPKPLIAQRFKKTVAPFLGALNFWKIAIPKKQQLLFQTL